MQFLLRMIGDVAPTLNTPPARSQALAHGQGAAAIRHRQGASSTRQFLPAAGISVPARAADQTHKILNQIR
jgi:hypothetical protein